MSNINVDLVLATRYSPETRNGLLTFLVEVPVFLWTEILTHKRICRNASSSRAQSTARHVAMGNYEPDVFYGKGTFMQAGEPLDAQTQATALAVWRNAWVYATEAAEKLAALGVCKEQANRVLPTTKMVRGVVTATEDAWQCFLKLRNHATADTAMQEMAREIADIVEQLLVGATETFIWWNYSPYHVPFSPKPVRDYVDYQKLAPLAAARLARVSTGKPAAGQRGDAELAQQLLADGHYSPFEHVARWVAYPLQSALSSKIEDCHFPAEGYMSGWQNLRSEMEVQDE